MSRELHAWPTARTRRLVELWPDPTRSILSIAHELGVSSRAVIRRAEHLALAGRFVRVAPDVPDEVDEQTGTYHRRALKALQSGANQRIGQGMLYGPIEHRLQVD
jgi:hypothetical protein